MGMGQDALFQLCDREALSANLAKFLKYSLFIHLFFCALLEFLWSHLTKQMTRQIMTFLP